MKEKTINFVHYTKIHQQSKKKCIFAEYNILRKVLQDVITQRKNSNSRDSVHI